MENRTRVRLIILVVDLLESQGGGLKNFEVVGVEFSEFGSNLGG